MREWWAFWSRRCFGGVSAWAGRTGMRSWVRTCRGEKEVMQRGGGGATMCVLATVSLSDVSGVFCGVIFHQWVYIGLMLPCNTGKPCSINTHFIKLGGVDQINSQMMSQTFSVRWDCAISAVWRLEGGPLWQAQEGWLTGPMDQPDSMKTDKDSLFDQTLGRLLNLFLGPSCKKSSFSKNQPPLPTSDQVPHPQPSSRWRLITSACLLQEPC